MLDLIDRFWPYIVGAAVAVSGVSAFILGLLNIQKTRYEMHKNRAEAETRERIIRLPTPDEISRYGRPLRFHKVKAIPIVAAIFVSSLAIAASTGLIVAVKKYRAHSTETDRDVRVPAVTVEDRPTPKHSSANASTNATKQIPSSDAVVAADDVWSSQWNRLSHGAPQPFAIAWLQVMDRHQYEYAYTFLAKESQDQFYDKGNYWANNEHFRTPLGVAIRRKCTSSPVAEFTQRSMPARSGDKIPHRFLVSAVIVNCRTEFTKYPEVEEIVVTVKQGGWRIFDYEYHKINDPTDRFLEQLKAQNTQ